MSPGVATHGIDVRVQQASGRQRRNLLGAVGLLQLSGRALIGLAASFVLLGGLELMQVLGRDRPVDG